MGLRERLAASGNARAELEAKFGFIPTSVIRDIGRGELSNRMFIYQREVFGRQVSAHDPTVGAKSEEALQVQKERQELGLVGGVLTTTKGTQRMGASVMPAELVEFFAKYYSAPGEVYLDPFMGQGVQMQVAHHLGMHYRGYDLSTEFFEYIDAVRAKIDNGTTLIDITHGDSRHPDNIPDGCGDFSFHSPPYWDIEYYGDEPGQLGQQSYEDFMVGMEDVYRAWLPKFKSGAYHVVNVNDFRRNKRFYPYHADTITAAVNAGWEMYDMWIIEGLIGGLSRVFAADKNKHKIAPKLHEYCIVFRAP